MEIKKARTSYGIFLGRYPNKCIGLCVRGRPWSRLCSRPVVRCRWLLDDDGCRDVWQGFQLWRVLGTCPRTRDKCRKFLLV
jgi:hypothetical protein